ncbi:SAM-dependent methyltransferase [Dactylosporangium sp. CA-092794]|uniref:SAM-dependent methyltransferase n=1 Tax=Dactylosporangium sp. CA-092794 TaxID=3239929 RepID=UPI003D8C47E9
MTEWVPEGVDVTAPNAARAYDFALGGFHNFEVDRQFVTEAARIWPEVIELAHVNRAFLGRAVRWLVDAGIRQFLDIGSGIPTLGNVHEVAQDVAPDCRVAYVDLDPVAVAHAQRILRDDPRSVAVRADLRDPASILGHRDVVGLLDLAEPTAVLMVAVLHFIEDDAEPPRIIREISDALVGGSFLAISHGVPALGTLAGQAAVSQMYRRTPTAFRPRPVAQITGWLDGWEPVAPGIVPINGWRPEPDECGAAPVAAVGVVARKQPDGVIRTDYPPPTGQTPY